MNIKVSHHLFLCSSRGKTQCCNYNESVESWEKLKELIKKNDLENNLRPQGIVLRSKVECLRICKDGPILLIWPDGIWYSKANPYKIELIINQHIICGSPIEDWIIKRTHF